MSTEEEFRVAMAEAGLEPPRDLIADGKIHRCGTVAKPRSRDGSYLLHLDGWPAGGFQNLAGGEWQKWCTPRTDMNRRQLPSRDVVRARVEAEKAERAREWAEAATRASEFWMAARPACPDHPYLVRKEIAPHRLRVRDGLLVAPFFEASGKIRTIQTIDNTGQKRFLRGGRKSGAFSPIGVCRGAPDVLVCEGIATGATLHEATGLPVIAAGDCTNLLPAAREFLVASPASRLTFWLAFLTRVLTVYYRGSAACILVQRGRAAPVFQATGPGRKWRNGAG
jgi:putative DNA primase/helicase